MLKQLIIVTILGLMLIVAYQIANNDNAVVPPLPYDPIVNPTFKFTNNGGYAMLKHQYIDESKYTVSFNIKTKSNGIIMASGGPILRNPVVPYVVIFLESHVLKFIHNGPSGGVVLYSDPNIITDDRWHSISISRDNMSWTMTVDGKPMSKASGRSDDIQRSTFTYFGNVAVKSELPAVDGLIGCLGNIALNGLIDLDFVTTGGPVERRC